MKTPQPHGEEHHDDSSSVVSTAAAELAANMSETVAGTMGTEDRTQPEAPGQVGCDE